MNVVKVRLVKKISAEIVELCDRYIDAQADSDEYHKGETGYQGRPYRPSITGTLPAALRRRSLDLTRALAEMRKP